MAVEQDRLDLGQQRVVLVDVSPPRLDHPDLRVAEVGHQAGQEIGGRNEVGVEDADELAARDLQAGFERARFVPDPIRAVVVLDVDAFRGEAAHRLLGDAARFVGRVVEHLDFEQLARIVHLADRVDQAVGDVHLVVDRQLDGDPRQHRERRRQGRIGGLVAIFHVKINDVIPVPPVDGEDTQDEEVKDEDECLRQRRHKEMKRSRDPIRDLIVGLRPKSTNPSYLPQ